MTFTMMVPTVIVPMVGLAIDGTMLFTVKAKLSSAVDGAALAAARSLSVGVDLDSQRASATKTADQYVRANFPAGYWGSFNLDDSQISISEDTTTTLRRRIVAISATVQVPLLFMRILGTPSTMVGANGTASRRDVRLVLLLDKSYSMLGTPMTNLKAAAASFVNKFAEGRDQVGLVVFGGAAVVAFPPFDPATGTGPASNFKTANPSVPDLINALQTGYTNTGTAEGLWLAYQELLKNPLPGALNVIVIFTDGMPNGISANFNASPDSVIGGTTSCSYPSTTDPTKYMIGTLAQEGNWSTSPGPVVGILQLMNAPDASHPTAQSWLAETGQESIIGSPPSRDCHYATSMTAIHADLAVLPSVDLYGNRTDGGGYIYSKLYHIKGGVGLDLTKEDVPYQVGLISWNAADDAARRIRSDLNITPVIYSIGLEGTNGADSVLMKRISNVDDPANTIYDPTKPAGMYIPVTDSAQISAAFTRIASEILRLTS